MSDIQGTMFGQQGVGDQHGDHDVIKFLIRQVLAMHRTHIPVKVVAVHGGGVGPPPTVDVLPLVNQIDGAGKATKHVTVYGLQVTRNHGGTNAVINDPVAGDIGWVDIGDRDHSAVMSQAAQANPGSFRRASISDGVYTSCLALKVTPNQYLIYDSDGIRLVDKNGNVIGMKSGKIYLNPNDLSGVVFLGGDGVNGTYDLVKTVSSVAVNVKARIG